MIEIDRSKAGKAIANLEGKQSERYTKLAQKLQKITDLDAEVKGLKAEVKAETKELIEDLFTAEDEIYTRVVETISASFTLSKKPDPTITIQYAKVVQDLEEHLTPELIKVLTQLKDKYSSVVNKQAALRFKIKTEYVDEGAQLLEELRIFRAVISNWARQFDIYFNQVTMALNENWNENPTSKQFISIANSLKSIYEEQEPLITQEQIEELMDINLKMEDADH